MHGPFDGNRVTFGSHLFVDCQQFQLDRHRAFDVTRHRSNAQFVHQLGCDVGRDTDIALTTAQHQSHCSCVVTGVDGEIFGGVFDQPLRFVDIATGFLDADDAGHLRQTQGGLNRHISHRATGHVVQHHWQRNGFGNGFEMQVLTFLGRLVVVGHDLQLAICTDLLGKFGQFNGFRGRVGTTACHDGHGFTTVCFGVQLGLLYRNTDDLAVFLHVDGGRFARGTDHADAVGAFGDVPVDELAQGRVIDAAVQVHRGGQSHNASSNHASHRCHIRWDIVEISIQ